MHIRTPAYMQGWVHAHPPSHVDMPLCMWRCRRAQASICTCMHKRAYAPPMQACAHLQMGDPMGAHAPPRTDPLAWATPPQHGSHCQSPATLLATCVHWREGAPPQAQLLPPDPIRPGRAYREACVCVPVCVKQHMHTLYGEAWACACQHTGVCTRDHTRTCMPPPSGTVCSDLYDASVGTHMPWVAGRARGQHRLGDTGYSAERLCPRTLAHPVMCTCTLTHSYVHAHLCSHMLKHPHTCRNTATCTHALTRAHTSSSPPLSLMNSRDVGESPGSSDSAGNTGVPSTVRLAGMGCPAAPWHPWLNWGRAKGPGEAAQAGP